MVPPEWRSRCARARRAVAARCCGPQNYMACGRCSPWGTGRTPCGGGAPRAHVEGCLAACPLSPRGLDGCIRTSFSRCMRCRRPRLLQRAPHSHSKLSRQRKGPQRRRASPSRASKHSQESPRIGARSAKRVRGSADRRGPARSLFWRVWLKKPSDDVLPLPSPSQKEYFYSSVPTGLI